MQAIFDIVIVGSGPGGMSAALNAHINNLNYILLEKTDHLSDTIFSYHKKKFTMVEPAIIPLRGALWIEPAVREEILSNLDEVAAMQNLNIRLNTPVTEIVKESGSFHVKTDAEVFNTEHVIIAIGTQGAPRKLGVPGEDLPHVLPRLNDPDMYSDQDIVVIGGGDAAIEIADALANQNRVTMAVRTGEFIRVKTSLERQALDRVKKEQMTIYFKSNVERIDPESVTLKLPASTVKVGAQVVIVKIGTLSPRSFLEKCGVRYPSTELAAPPPVNAFYETNVPLFLIGAVGGRKGLIKHAINEGYEVIEHICGREVEPADEEILKEKLKDFPAGTVTERIKKILLTVPVLAGAAEEEIREILLFSQFQRFSPGEIIFRQHDFSDSFYMILEGTVEVLVKTDDGVEKVVATGKPGEFFGEMSLISGRRRSATIRGGSQGSLWEVSRKAMLKFLHTTPSAQDFINKTFVIRSFQSYLFPNLDHEILSQLADKATVRTVEKGAIIIKEGEPGDAFYFLRSGKVKVSKMLDGREIVLSYLSAGQYFGEIALLMDKPRSATVAAIDRVEVVQLSKDYFLAFLDYHPELKKQIEDEAMRRELRTVEVEMRPEIADLGRFMVNEEVVVSENVLLIDENKCIHCDNCVKACIEVHEDGQTRIKRTGMKFANILVANSCRHCENPLCMTDCPPGDAILRDPRGEVYIRDNCIACGRCAENCPYDNIFMVQPEKKWSPFDWMKEALGIQKPDKEADKSIPVKCDLCRGLDGGPACVQSCPTGAVLRLTPGEYNKTIESLVLQRKGLP